MTWEELIEWRPKHIKLSNAKDTLWFKGVETDLCFTKYGCVFACVGGKAHLVAKGVRFDEMLRIMEPLK